MHSMPFTVWNGWTSKAFIWSNSNFPNGVTCPYSAYRMLQLMQSNKQDIHMYIKTSEPQLTLFSSADERRTNTLSHTRSEPILTSLHWCCGMSHPERFRFIDNPPCSHHRAAESSHRSH